MTGNGHGRADQPDRDAGCRCTVQRIGQQLCSLIMDEAHACQTVPSSDLNCHANLDLEAGSGKSTLTSTRVNVEFYRKCSGTYDLADMIDGGQGGIRTRGTLSRTHTFQACALNHSATCPQNRWVRSRQPCRSGAIYNEDSLAINRNLSLRRLAVIKLSAIFHCTTAKACLI